VKVTILGCGTSSGVPRIGGIDGAGDWGACDPDNPKNRRRRVSLLVSDRARPVKFRFEPEELEVFVRNVDRGEVSETLPVELEGGAITIGFNPRYLQDILSVVSGDTLTLELSNPLLPCLVRDPSFDRAFFVVMPMRLD
jgi:DNA polymerase III sliding clamp (beta) subunit (PCNA family)